MIVAPLQCQHFLTIPSTVFITGSFSLLGPYSVQAVFNDFATFVISGDITKIQGAEGQQANSFHLHT